MAKKKQNKSNILLALVFLAGLSLMLYPTVSNYLHSKVQSGVVSGYQQLVQTTNTEEHVRMISQARQYNELLAQRENPYVLPEEMLPQYEALLDFSGSGMMGYLEIPCIDVSLPVYHGVEEDVLQQAIGHLEWTSLPVGGENTHCVISGHRGLPTADLLTHIDRMRMGDHFYLNVLGETLEYQVDQIKVVLPEDTDDLIIEEGQDYVTLLTCTPYGINSHRLLVRGTRILDGKPASGKLILSNEIEEVSLVYIVPVALTFFVVVMLCAIGIGSLTGKKAQRKHKKVYRKEKGREKEQNDL